MTRVWRFDGYTAHARDWAYVRQPDGEVIEFARYLERRGDESRLNLDRAASQAIESSTGFLRGQISVTRTGVFRYRNRDGSTRLEARLAEDVFSPTHLDSIRMAVVVDGHPLTRSGKPVDVTTNNVTRLQRGQLGSALERAPSGGYEVIRSDVLVTARPVIASMIRRDRFQTSLGYLAELEETPGEFAGPDGPEPYHVIQRNQIVNHDAVNISAGRGGPSVRVHLTADALAGGWSSDRRGPQTTGREASRNHRSRTMDEQQIQTTMIRLDTQHVSVPVTAAPQIMTAFETVNAKVKAETARADTAQAELKKRDEELATAKKELETEKAKPARTDAAIMLKVLDGARRLGAKFDEKQLDEVLALTPDAARRQVLTAINADAAKGLEGQSEGYVEGVFAMAVQAAGKRKDAKGAEQAAALFTVVSDAGSQAGNRGDSDADADAGLDAGVSQFN